MKWIATESPEENACRVLPKMARKFLKTGRELADEPGSYSQMHEFRLKAKRLRYTLEMFASFYGPGLRTRLDSLKKVQQLLGEINDFNTVLGLPGVGADPQFNSWLNRKRDQRKCRFTALWNELFRSEAGWADYFAKCAKRKKQ